MQADARTDASRVALADVASLVAEVHALVRRWEDSSTSRRQDAQAQSVKEAGILSLDVGRIDPEAFASETGFKPRRQGKPELVLASDVAVELGHPTTASQTIVLATTQTDLVSANRVTIRGPDLDEATVGARLPFGQVVMLALRAGAQPDPFELESAALLINRLPGYMVRSVPGRQWVRVGKRGLAAGLTLETVGRALVATYETEFRDVVGVEVLFVTGSEKDVEALAPIALEASVTAGRHKKLVLSADGDLDCFEMSCDECDEKPVCDDLREVLRQRRKTK